ncbi:MAG: DUF1638 domain-containing protein [Chloroflexi bacterium]|nr:DUF1638 domain-containing protein [Chloroflexota bacterium]
MMRFKLISCEVLARQAYYVAAFSPHVVDIELVDKGLHREPDVLRAHLQERIDAIPKGQYDALLLGYGLCSNTTVGLICPHLKMVLPRAHDCITLYLGSARRYGEEFRANPGTYWYTPDYMERGGSSNDQISLGVTSDDHRMDEVYQEYVAKYGKDNADYLMEVMGAWKKHYNRAAYIETQEIRLPDYRDEVRTLAQRRGWNFQQLAGSLILIRDLLEGRWDEERFLIVPPGHTITPTYDDRIVTACPII